MSDTALDTYYEVCEKFNTNLREILDFLSAEFKFKGDDYRINKLRKIVDAGYDLARVIEGYKKDYVENVEKPYVLDGLFFALHFLIKDLIKKNPHPELFSAELKQLDRDYCILRSKFTTITVQSLPPRMSC